MKNYEVTVKISCKKEMLIRANHWQEAEQIAEDKIEQAFCFLEPYTSIALNFDTHKEAAQ